MNEVAKPKMTDRDALRMLDEVAANSRGYTRPEQAALQEAAMKLAVLVAAEEKRQEQRASEPLEATPA